MTRRNILMQRQAAHNILLTGLPRSGTTLSCYLLNRLPDTVALHEPMRVRDFAALGDHQAICQSIERYCLEQRDTLRASGRARSKQVAGAVPTNSHQTATTETGLRMPVVSGGDLVIDKPLSEEFFLVIKHIAAFAAIVEEAARHFPVYALVRNPLAILASWNSIDFGFRQGHAPAAERLDPALAPRLNAIDDQIERQFALLSWFFEQFSRHVPASNVIRYETLIESGGRNLAVIQPEAADLAEPLESHNTNPLYDREGTMRIGEQLLQADGAYWEFYSKESVEALLAEFAAAAPSG
jgi:hypothetical protein